MILLNRPFKRMLYNCKTILSLFWFIERSNGIPHVLLDTVPPMASGHHLIMKKDIDIKKKKSNGNVVMQSDLIRLLFNICQISALVGILRCLLAILSQVYI